MLVMMGLALLVLIALDTWAITKVRGTRSENEVKNFWTILILVLPLLGFVVWYLAGPRRRP